MDCRRLRSWKAIINSFCNKKLFKLPIDAKERMSICVCERRETDDDVSPVYDLLIWSLSFALSNFLFCALGPFCTFFLQLIQQTYRRRCSLNFGNSWCVFGCSLGAFAQGQLNIVQQTATTCRLSSRLDLSRTQGTSFLSLRQSEYLIIEQTHALHLLYQT